MIHPEWPGARIALTVLLAVVLASLLVNAILRDRKAFERFAALTSSTDRRRTMRRWLVRSFALFGGLALVSLVLDWRYAARLRDELWRVHWIALLRSADPVIVGVVVAAAIIALAVLTIMGIRAARAEGASEVPSVGEVQALLPRNRRELPWGALLSVNAGVVEELLFRLSLPALVYAVSGNAALAVIGSLLLFGALHAYQGVAGVVGTALLGTVFMAVYVATGSIVAAIVVHALFDLRSLVLIPIAVMRVHRIRA